MGSFKIYHNTVAQIPALVTANMAHEVVMPISHCSTADDVLRINMNMQFLITVYYASRIKTNQYFLDGTAILATKAHLRVCLAL